MATVVVASRLLRAASHASLASRTAASRAAAMASRSARAAAAATTRAARSGLDASTKPRPRVPAPRHYFSAADYEHFARDLESDEAVWALYERWCRAFGKERDRAEMARRFKIFRYNAKQAHHWNTRLPPDPEEAAVYLRKRREVGLLLSRGEDVSSYDEEYLPTELGPFADGGDPDISESNKRLLKAIEEMEMSSSAVEDVAAE